MSGIWSREPECVTQISFTSYIVTVWIYRSSGPLARMPAGGGSLETRGPSERVIWEIKDGMTGTQWNSISTPASGQRLQNWGEWIHEEEREPQPGPHAHGSLQLSPACRLFMMFLTAMQLTQMHPHIRMPALRYQEERYAWPASCGSQALCASLCSIFSSWSLDFS